MATLPVFRTWVAGEITTAANMNSNIRDAGNFFLSWPVFEGRQTVLQSIANNTNTAILLDTEDIDTDNGHSTVTNTSRYTPATAGRFQVSGAVSFAASGTGTRLVELAKNGSSVNGSGTTYATLAAGVPRCPSRTMTMTANGSTDFFELIGAQGSGGALNTSVGGSDQPSMSVRMVGTT